MLILAHRGLPSIDCPENSVAAIAAAFDRGADGVEVDLRLTADGVLAVSHDEDLHRLTGVPMAIADSTWLTLRDTAGRRGVQLARAEDVLAEVAGRRIVLEIKQPPRGGTSEIVAAVAVADLLRGLQRSGVDLDVTVSSFAPDIVATVRTLLPRGSGVRTALLGCPEDRASEVLRQAAESGHDELHPHVRSLLAQPTVVAAAEASAVTVVPWTVNTTSDMRLVQQLGVYGLITDVPATARAALSSVTA